MTERKAATTRKAAPKETAKPRYSKRTVSACPFDKLNVRAQPKANASILRTLNDGEPVSVAPEVGSWCEVEDGGYVMAKHVV